MHKNIYRYIMFHLFRFIQLCTSLVISIRNIHQEHIDLNQYNL